MIDEIVSFTDGASRGNPGHASIGILLLDKSGHVIAQEHRYLGIATNNEAEYRALILALEMALARQAKAVRCFMDSELVQRQLIGQYKVKSEKMAELHGQVKNLASRFESVTFSHVRREHPNQKIADALANKALDERSKKGGENG